MILGSNPPGPWQFYVNRADNKGLSIAEIKSKYLMEQFLFEQQMNFLMQQQLLMSQQASGGGLVSPSSTIDPSENNYVENNYIDNYFE